MKGIKHSITSNGRKHHPSSLGFWGRLRRFPSWAIWLIGTFCAMMYVYLFYNFCIGSLSIRWQALYGQVPEPDETLYPIRGIDISHYQSQIDWDKLNYATIKYKLIRFIFIKATDGADGYDKSFEDNFEKALDNGFIRGAYHYFRAGDDPADQAKFFLSNADLIDGDLPPVIDIEEVGDLSKNELQSAVKTWLKIVESRYKVKPIIYTNFKFKIEYLDDPYFDQYPYWIAHYYRSTLEYKGKWMFWQYNDCGAVDGINGSVDFNVFNGSIEDLRKICISSQAKHNN